MHHFWRSCFCIIPLWIGLYILTSYDASANSNQEQQRARQEQQQRARQEQQQRARQEQQQRARQEQQQRARQEQQQRARQEQQQRARQEQQQKRQQEQQRAQKKQQEQQRKRQEEQQRAQKKQQEQQQKHQVKADSKPAHSIKQSNEQKRIKNTSQNSASEMNKSKILNKEKPTKQVAKAHEFPVGYCTRHSATKFNEKSKVPITWSGNAEVWMSNASQAGFKTSAKASAAKKGAIICWQNGGEGHVGYVEKVKGNKVTISEMNWVGFNKTDIKTLSTTDLNRGTFKFAGYIYPK